MKAPGPKQLRRKSDRSSRTIAESQETRLGRYRRNRLQPNHQPREFAGWLEITGVAVRKRWSKDPGRIVYRDRNQVAAVLYTKRKKNPP